MRCLRNGCVSRTTLTAALAVAAALVFAQAASAATGDYIVVLKGSANESAVAFDHAAHKGAKIRKHYHYALNGYAAELSDQALASVRSDPNVDFVTPDRRFHVPRDEHKTRPVGKVIPKNCQQVIPFSVGRIGGLVSSAISGNCRGSVDANVAVIDSGIDPTHPDLNVVGGTDCSADGGGL